MEILVRLRDGSCPDQTANPLRGYIVCLRPDGHQWGLAEVPPEYGSVSVPGLDPRSVIDRERSWRMRVGVEVVAADYAQDIFTLRASATAYNTRTGEGKITAAILMAAKVVRFLESWAATDITFADNAATFTVRVADAYRTNAFWGIGIDGLVFSEIAYDEATGVHRVRINYSALTLTTEERDKLRVALAESSTFVSINTGQKGHHRGHPTLDGPRAVPRGGPAANRAGPITATALSAERGGLRGHRGGGRTHHGNGSTTGHEHH